MILILILLVLWNVYSYFISNVVYYYDMFDVRMDGSMQGETLSYIWHLWIMSIYINSATMVVLGILWIFKTRLLFRYIIYSITILFNLGLYFSVLGSCEELQVMSPSKNTLISGALQDPYSLFVCVNLLMLILLGLLEFIKTKRRVQKS